MGCCSSAIPAAPWSGNPVELIANVPWGWATGRGHEPAGRQRRRVGLVSNSDTAGTADFKLTGLQYAGMNGRIETLMKTFRDTAGREWAITVDVNAIKRVMKAPIEHLGEPLKVNLLGPGRTRTAIC